VQRRRPEHDRRILIPLSARQTWGATKARWAKLKLRRRACFDPIASGYSHHEIAAAFGVSLATVRRDIDTALAGQPLQAREG
jgi:DNA-directed RNA polymerase specialized sigma24 family protein